MQCFSCFLKFSVQFFANFARTLLSFLFVGLMRRHIDLSMKFSFSLQKAFMIHSISFLAFYNNLCFHVNSLFYFSWIFLIRFDDAHFDQLLMFFLVSFYTRFGHLFLLSGKTKIFGNFYIFSLVFLESCFGSPEPY